MKRFEITRRLEEAVCQLRTLLTDDRSDSRLQPRDPLFVPDSTARSLPSLSIEDLFEAELGRTYYGQSLLRDIVTHQPLEVENILQALGYTPEVTVAALNFIRRALQPTFEIISHECGALPLVMFWFNPPSTLSIRVITQHDNANAHESLGGALSGS